MKNYFKKILIANRGEIAVRVMRACRELGITTVAVYSDVDADALHVRTADEAFRIGEAPPGDSYLNIEKILDTAKNAGADAIHPGYGFLAENWQFAKECEEAGLVFIGPGWEAMKLLGNKIESRKAMMSAGVPVIPGMMTKGATHEEIEKNAREIGFPVLLKAAAGGGGKGMRVVEKEEDLAEAYESAMREAGSAFGDDSVYLEKFLVKPRHIEFQVLADNYGSTIHLFERECSIQRRHQKVVEESPSPVLDKKLRQQMGEAAVKAVKQAGYRNAGTVEFLLDADRNFYFLEVNARLQVEHPVTELVTGTDLVHEQIRVAAGEKLSLKQDELKQTGHAIEVRLYAEDAENGFIPSGGKVLFTSEPKGPGIRVDSGIFTGCEVPVFYDPIMAKLIVSAPDRDTAILRMDTALDEFPVLGVHSTGSFLQAVMRNPVFRSGDLSTDFLEREAEYFDRWKAERNGVSAKHAAAASILLKTSPSIKKAGPSVRTETSPWQLIGDWQIGNKL